MPKANPLIDAATTLVGYTNATADRAVEKIYASGETVKLSTRLDAALSFTMVASHPGNTGSLTIELEVAPELTDGTIGTWVSAATAAIPAAGGRVESYISGQDLAVDAADASSVELPAFCYARATVTTSDASPAPAGTYVGLTATVAA
jgi:hypothetical protein